MFCVFAGFDGTSNVLAGKLYGIPVKGTHAHAFVTSYTALEDLRFKVDSCTLLHCWCNTCCELFNCMWMNGKYYLLLWLS